MLLCLKCFGKRGVRCWRQKFLAKQTNKFFTYLCFISLLIVRFFFKAKRDRIYFAFSLSSSLPTIRFLLVLFPFQRHAVWKCTMNKASSMKMQHWYGQQMQTYNKDMQHGHAAIHWHAARTYSMKEHATWIWMEMLHGHLARTCRMDIQQGHGAWTFSTDMQHGHDRTCHKQHGHAARICNMDMLIDSQHHMHGHECTYDTQHGHGVIRLSGIKWTLYLIGWNSNFNPGELKP